MYCNSDLILSEFYISYQLSVISDLIVLVTLYL